MNARVRAELALERDDQRGVVALEYLLVVIAAMLAGGASLLAIGRMLYASYVYQTFALYYIGP